MKKVDNPKTTIRLPEIAVISEIVFCVSGSLFLILLIIINNNF